jgi:hypothetical protein
MAKPEVSSPSLSLVQLGNDFQAILLEGMAAFLRF